VQGYRVTYAILIKNVKTKFVAWQLGYFIKLHPDDLFLDPVVKSYLKVATAKRRIPVYTIQQFMYGLHPSGPFRAAVHYS